jgi:hypothetical protein
MKIQHIAYLTTLSLITSLDIILSDLLHGCEIDSLNLGAQHTYIKEQRFHDTQYIYIINNVELNSGQHVSITQDHLQALIDTFLMLKQSYM